MKHLFIFLCFCLIACQNQQSDQTENDPPQIDTPKVVVETPPPPKVLLDTFPKSDTAWINIEDYADDILIDIRYATANNFVGEKMYDCGKCYLRNSVAQALLKVHKAIQEKGYGGIKVYDCYRPRPFQQRLWDKVPDPRYVTRPEKGSMHNRGHAVDLTIYDKEGNELDMGTEYDYFGEEAWQTYKEHSDTILNNRNLLNHTMQDYGFMPIRTEWWHYSYTKKGSSPISDMLWDCSDMK